MFIFFDMLAFSKQHSSRAPGTAAIGVVINPNGLFCMNIEENFWKNGNKE